MGKGDKIATFMGNGLEMLEIYWAAPLSSPFDFMKIVDGVKTAVSNIRTYLLINDETIGNGAMDGYQNYAALMADSSEDAPKGIIISHFPTCRHHPETRFNHKQICTKKVGKRACWHTLSMYQRGHFPR